jgi:threonine/homoserine/homoserine lactone efflux protein
MLQQGVPDGDATAVDTASQALAHGYTTGFLTGAGLLLAAAVLVAVTVTTRSTQHTADTQTVDA